jgi:hypothetical protein
MRTDGSRRVEELRGVVLTEVKHAHSKRCQRCRRAVTFRHRHDRDPLRVPSGGGDASPKVNQTPAHRLRIECGDRAR